MAVAQLACDLRTAGVNATPIGGEPPTLHRCTCAPSRRCNVCLVVVILIYSPTLLVCAAAAEGTVEGYHGQIYDPLNQATYATNLRQSAQHVCF